MDEHERGGGPSHERGFEPGGRRNRRLAVAAAVAGAGALGAGLATGFAFGTAHSSAALLNPSTPLFSTTTGGSTAAGGAGASSGASADGSSLDTTAVATAVDPGIVDITSTLASGHGVAMGTGMVVTSSGEVLTNNHVIEGASSISAQIDGSGPAYTVSVLGRDATHDVALLQIEGVSNLTTVTLGDSSSLAEGQAVAALGNAGGRGGTPAVSRGVVSMLDQTITASGTASGVTETLSGLIQVAAQIEPGDSGGPLVDSSGRVVGMTTAAATVGDRPSRTTNLAFAIPINAALAIVRQIESGIATSTVRIGPGS
ncbi:MAG TPA: trypsin-like peptidase domain-containing protein [Candidatus Dormibacteraeota bacterium]|nr:trypsin-like peptidase domain-containing protein [Candidatus Dormibacteraeota bacterium]